MAQATATATATATRMAGKVALVTGAASGLGLGAAIALAQEGATLVMSDVAQTDGRAAARAIAEAGGRAEFHGQDVTCEEAWADLIALIEQRHGALHVLVNNAGIAINHMTLDMSLADWRRQMAVNVDGVFLGCKHGLPLMARSGGGSVINISSVAGLRGAAGLAGYCASKGAVRLFTKALALECAAAGNGVRVNSVHPGIIETPIWNRMENVRGNLRDAMTPADGANTVDVQMLAPLVPMGTVGTPADIAAGILYLASDDSRYVTGTELVIDGGMTAGG
ncbi:MAG: SDR family NAD(P)-dependent oxidoreductase [Alphaproteobacteria bacterium]